MPSHAPSLPAGADFRVIGLVSLAHGSSHFFQMMLPPLFPVFIRDFGLSYSQLGLLVSMFFVISGVGQALSGFLVDRVGARPVLLTAMACFVAAGLAAATAQGLGGLMWAAALAGVGNAAIHPCDFTILNQRVSLPRLGHAFSAHGISGNLGWAVAPLFMIGIAEFSGNWRIACAAAALWGLLVLLLLAVRREEIDDRARAPVFAVGSGAGAGAAEHPLAFLRLPSVWMCFSFFFWSTVAIAAIQSFSGPALSSLYGMPLSATAFVVTGYMLCGIAGMVAGGFVAARVAALEKTIAIATTASALLFLLVASTALPGWLAASVAALAGFGTGLAGPSRDMLIKQASPPGATGRVYGMVYSGLDVGFALAAPAFGWLLDHGHTRGVFVGAAMALMMGVASAALVALQLRSRPAVAPAAALP